MSIDENLETIHALVREQKSGTRLAVERYIFTLKLVIAIMAKGTDGEICRKRRISRISQGADQVPVGSHKQVKLEKLGRCVCCKGLRFKDRPKNRVALAQIAITQGRESSRHDTFYGCKQCDVHLCKNRGCFDVFHR